MLPFSEFSPDSARALRFVLHDIDDTVTENGRLPAAAYDALWAMHEAGLSVIPVTGRPAGWCDLIIREWPVQAVIGEGGAFVYYWEDGHVKTYLHPNAVSDARVRAKPMIDAVLSEVPGVRIARDQFSRLYDTAFDFREEAPFLPTETGYDIIRVCERFGAVAKMGTAHVNAWFGDYDKADMSMRFLKRVLGEEKPEETVLYFGDSPNDEPMFRAFPMSCGVANVLERIPEFSCLPRYVTRLPAGSGFAEAVRTLLARRAERA